MELSKLITDYSIKHNLTIEEIAQKAGVKAIDTAYAQSGYVIPTDAYNALVTLVRHN